MEGAYNSVCVPRSMNGRSYLNKSRLSVEPKSGVGKRIVPFVLLVHVLLVGIGAWVHSPTLDEPAYLAAGLRHLHTGRFDTYKVTPPLVRTIAAIPLLLLTDFDDPEFRDSTRLRPEFDAGKRFLAAHGKQSFWLVTVARWACIPFTVLGALCLYLWAKEFYGVVAGHAAIILWCFCPNVIAHAQLLTPDIAVTAMCTAYMYLAWKWRDTPSWLSSIALGGVLGIAVLCKTSAILLIPVSLLVELYRVRTMHHRIGIGIARYIVSIFVMTNVVNLGYLYESSPCNFAEVSPRSATINNLLSLNSSLRGISIPLPLSCVEGVDLQLVDLENRDGGIKTFVLGRWRSRSVWWYYLYATLLKMPMGTLCLIAIGLLNLCMRKSQEVRGQTALFVVLPLTVAFLIPTLSSGFGSGIRYVLPAFPFLYMIASSFFFAGATWRVIGLRNSLLAWSVIGTFASYPHCLSYFNELAGGSENGHNHLLEGSVDYGQDLLFVLEWRKDIPEKDVVYLDYWGPLRVEEIDKSLHRLPASCSELPAHGWCAISVNHLHEGRNEDDSSTRTYFARHEPTCRLTPAIYVYEFERDGSMIRVAGRRR